MDKVTPLRRGIVAASPTLASVNAILSRYSIPETSHARAALAHELAVFADLLVASERHGITDTLVYAHPCPSCGASAGAPCTLWKNGAMLVCEPHETRKPTEAQTNASLDEQRNGSLFVCSCHRVYTPSEWNDLDLVGYHFEDGEDDPHALELRNCATCQSTRARRVPTTVALIAAINEARDAKVKLRACVSILRDVQRATISLGKSLDDVDRDERIARRMR